MSKNFFIPEPYRSDKPFRVRILPPVQPTHNNHKYIVKNHNAMNDLIDILYDKRYERKDKRICFEDLLKEDSVGLLYIKVKSVYEVNLITKWFISLNYKYLLSSNPIDMVDYIEIKSDSMEFRHRYSKYMNFFDPVITFSEMKKYIDYVEQRTY